MPELTPAQDSANFFALLVTTALIVGVFMLLGSRVMRWLDAAMAWLLVRPQERAAKRRFERGS